MCAYAIGNAVGPFVWKEQYQPRNHVPWTVLTVCSFVSGILILLLRFMLAAENKRREAEPYDDTYDEVYIVVSDADGNATEKKVDKVCALLLGPWTLVDRHGWVGLICVAVVLGPHRQAEPRVPVCALIVRFYLMSTSLQCTPRSF